MVTPAEPPRAKLTADAPVGLYWATPLIIVLCLIRLLWWNPAPQYAWTLYLMWFLVLASVIIQAVRQRLWDREQHRRRLLTLESLIQLTTCMGTDIQAETRMLQALPHTIRILMGIHLSCVAILEDEGKTLHIVASEGFNPPLDGQRFPIDSLPMTRQCIQTKYVTAVADTRHPSEPLNSDLAAKLNLRMMIHIPMVYQDRVIGLMVLGEPRPRAITDMDKRRAWLWGCQAAVMLANCRLYSEMNQSLQKQNRLWEHRDALYAINTAIHRPGTLKDILQRIVDLAPRPLEVDAAWVWLLAEDNPNDMVMAAASNEYDAKVAGFRLTIRGSRAESVLLQRRELVVENAPSDRVINEHLRQLLPNGSIIFEPLLRGDGQPLGLLVMGRWASGPFEPDQLNMARMFCSRAAAIIETAQLYEQTRSAADDKAMLLRELNHRVKNNLASIVSLLSLNQPELNPEARQWLNRAVERISAMAQMHELFAGGAHRVTLTELIDQTVRSLSVAKPPGVVVLTHLEEGRTSLRTDRAVSLAMAMHELCFNGFVHNLEHTGTLTIRSRRCNGDLAVEVEDDAGTGRPASSPIEQSTSPHGSGIGLSLVRGLVGRELQGRFTLAPAPGGAIATVQFPLLPDELS